MTEMFRWTWVFGRWDEILEKLGEHIWLTLVAVVVGSALALPLAIYGSRHRRALALFIGTSGLLYTIPSLALFAFLIPLTGLSMLTAEIGLVGYTLLILIRNTVTGLDAVPSETKEAASGMGLTRRQLLWRVEIPLALPSIVAGLRIATVTTIGLVTITSLIGLGGLGHYILFGLQRNFSTAVLLGMIGSVILALIADLILLWTERRIAPWLSDPLGTGRVD